jgi:hypothetical protein
VAGPESKAPPSAAASAQSAAKETPTPPSAALGSAPSVTAGSAPAGPPSPAPSSLALACEIKGAPVLAKGATFFAEPQGSGAIATFAGQPVPLVITGFPAGAGQGRIPARTTGGLRIEGFVDTADLPLYTAGEVALVPGHVWLAQGQRMSFVAASREVSAEASVTGPVTQTFRVNAPCSLLALERQPRARWDVPGNGRGYLSQRSSLDLRDQPGGNVIQTIRVTEPASGLLLWSTETQGGFVHVVYHEDLVIDAWVASADLVALKQGETMDRLEPSQVATGSARLSIGGQPTLVRAEKPVPLRLAPQDTAKPVGTIEQGGEVYLIQTVLGWTSVLPRALNILPPGDRSFWVPLREVGAAR